MNLPVHPDTIIGLAPDCRRVLREEYARVQIAVDRARIVQPPRRGAREMLPAARTRTPEEVSRATAEAITEYRRVAAMWGVEV